MDKIKGNFKDYINQSFQFKGDSIIVGGAIYEGDFLQNTFIKLPLKSLNRHGLIAGATGTGKTKTLQVLAENLSEKGIPILLMDIKGDLSGIAAEGDMNKHIESRHQAIGIPWEAKATPVEFLSLSHEKGVRLRATISEFGPVLFSKILELNDTQAGIVSVIFKYCDDNQIPLLDLKDFKQMLQFISEEGKEEIEKEYGKISGVSASTILRKVIEIEQQEADLFFGEKSFDVKDLVRTNKDGQGIVSIIRLTDIQEKPKLFSTFMLSLLAEMYSTFPEEGDLDQPKLMVFIDEAHLIFEEASKALLDQIEVIIKLIRSKGIGIYFCTQNPTDVPDDVLGQLGLKIQHALRAFTAKDRKDIKRTAENYPISPYYKTDEVLTSLGIGEALISALDEKGRPTPLAATLLRAPKSRMDVLSEKEIQKINRQSDLVEKYEENIDRESAYEILSEKIELAQSKKNQEKVKEEHEKAARQSKNSKSLLEEISKNTMVRQVGRTLAREIARGLLGVLGVRRR